MDEWTINQSCFNFQYVQKLFCQLTADTPADLISASCFFDDSIQLVDTIKRNRVHLVAFMDKETHGLVNKPPIPECLASIHILSNSI